MSAQINLDKLIVNVERVLLEIKNLFNGRMGKDMLTENLKQDICNKVRMSGHDMLGGCEGMDYLFPLISVTHSYVNENMIFLVTIPIKPNYDIDQFKLYRVLSLPVNLNKTAIKLVVGGGRPFYSYRFKIFS